VVADQKPPRLVSSEAETVHALLQYQRESLVRKVTGVDETSARWSPVGTGTSLLWLIRHMTGAEASWVLHRFAGQDQVPSAGDQADNQADDQADGALEAAIAGYRRGWERVDAVVFAAASLDELCRRPDTGQPVSLRWVLMHLLEETARHAGHADIIRELIDGSTGR
jgi:uncharacterized damage-inducible protein DinB